ncbi:MAG: DNA gyrase subunit A [Candidatus Woesearchaeota archaeon]
MESNQNSEKTQIIPVDVVDELKTSYLDYAMSVIVGRALPDVRDGLKPVQRRILFAAKELSLYHNQPHKKSARLVGEVLGKYHPHGDAAIYEAIVRMAQPFSLRYPLIDGQGNFGSIDGDSPAAMRYTEVRLSKLSEEMLEDLEKETVDFIPNFDNTLEEPVVLPTKIPNLLLNGSSGIAVGMATNIPPHNLKEVCDAIIALINNENISLEELMKIIKGPDFPTGGIIEGKDGLIKAYTTGKGKIIVSCKYHFEETKNKTYIVIDEIPYQTSKAEIIKELAELVKNSEIEIEEIRDESDRKHGVRIVLELEKNKDREIVLNKILSKTQLRTSYNILFLSLVKNQPRVLSLKEMLQYFINHRIEVIRRKTSFLKKKSQERLHIVNGLVRATENIEKTVEILKNSINQEDAISKLMEEYSLDEVQSKAILDMKLGKIISLERDKLIEEKQNLENEIKEFTEILGSEERIKSIILKEMEELKEKYGDERRTQIKEFVETYELEDLISDEKVAILLDEKGFIKRIELEDLKKGSRNNRATEKINESIRNILVTSNKQYLLLITKSGKIFLRKAYMIEEGTKKEKGMHTHDLINIKDDPIVAMCSFRTLEPSNYVVLVTSKGYIKKISLSEFVNLKNAGIIGIRLEEDEYVKSIFIIRGNEEILIGTKKGKCIRFDSSKVPTLGRNARGVIGIRLESDDEVLNAFAHNPDEKNFLLGIASNGKGKRTNIEEFSKTGRGGKGVRYINSSDAIFCDIVKEDDEIVLVSLNGYARRLEVKEIPVMNRNAKGVYLFRPHQNDKIICGVVVRV